MRRSNLVPVARGELICSGRYTFFLGIIIPWFVGFNSQVDVLQVMTEMTTVVGCG